MAPDAITALDPGRRTATGDVGRLNPYNVVIGPLDRHGVRALRTPVVVDLSHPTMFDHPLDHVPGMLQMEVVRQARRLARRASWACRRPRASCGRWS